MKNSVFLGVILVLAIISGVVGGYFHSRWVTLLLLASGCGTMELLLARKRAESEKEISRLNRLNKLLGR